MTVKELEELFDEVIYADTQLRDAHTNLKQVKADNPIPSQPTRTTIAEWIEYRTQADNAKHAIKEAEDLIGESNNNFLDAKRKLMKVIPSKVWFHYKDYGIGISYTNWGGSQYNLEVQPWKDEMPSLDQIYRGD